MRRKQESRTLNSGRFLGLGGLETPDDFNIIDKRELGSHILPRTLNGDDCLKRGILSRAEIMVLCVFKVTRPELAHFQVSLEHREDIQEGSQNS